MAGAFIQIRVEPTTKERIETAARHSGRTLTSFVLDAVGKAVADVERQQARKPKGKKARGVLRGVPKFFKDAILEAHSGGGGGTYALPAYLLAQVIRDKAAPLDVELSEWPDSLEVLFDALTDEDHDAVWSWFTTHYVDCMSWVPSRRKDQFLIGVFRAWNEGKI